jgi:hypothetical protein
MVDWAASASEDLMSLTSDIENAELADAEFEDALDLQWRIGSASQAIIDLIAAYRREIANQPKLRAFECDEHRLALNQLI